MTLFFAARFCLLAWALSHLFVPLSSLVASAKGTVRTNLRISDRQSDPCADIFNSEYTLFAAQDAYNCLISVPFNATVALQFLQYYKDTLQFQSTLAYLKSPPPSYQQPAVDLLLRLDRIESDVTSGVFTNEYDFEVAVQTLIYAAHDSHLVLYAGALTIFSFGSPYRIVSVSTDGISLPKVFITDDLIESQYYGATWQPSAVSAINGQDTTEFLAQFAAQNAQGTLEPHADWNQLMSSAADDIQGQLSIFEGSSIFYPGEYIQFDFENDTTTGPIPWIASYHIPDDTPSIKSGADIYSYFVLGNDPSLDSSSTIAPAATSSDNSQAATDTSTTSPAITSDSTAPTSTSGDPAASTPPSWHYFPYPSNPNVVQPNLGDANGGVITGYILADDITAVLSIPSFHVNGEAIQSFSSTVAEFIQRSKAAGCTRVIIDLQRNEGGGDLLATDAFKQFFPSIDPFNGARLRAHPYADALGNTYTQYFNTDSTNDDFYQELAVNAWVGTDYLNADTGENFTSWGDFFGPHASHGDSFTSTQRYNLSSSIFDENASGGIVVYGYANRTMTTPQPYDAKDIVLLSDALCSSACSAFVEMMHHEAGVRSVVVGGLPQLGAMQMPSGSRGAQAYSTIDLDPDIDIAKSVNASVTPALPNREVAFALTFAGFNLKDAVRKGSDVPLQFAYEAADCRIFYTPRTVYNYENLWNYVVDAIWNDPSLCIAGSTNQPSAGKITDTTGPTASQKNQWATTPSNSVAALILKGFSAVKRSFESQSTPLPIADEMEVSRRDVAGLDPMDPKLSTIIEDGNAGQSPCAQCSGPTLTCSRSIPQCSQPGFPPSNHTGARCRHSCNTQQRHCPNKRQCHIASNSTRGSCEPIAVIKAFRNCPGSGPKPQQDTKPPVGNNSPGLPSYQYAAPVSVSNPQNNGIAPSPIPSGGKIKKRRAGLHASRRYNS